jgi:hypothetical protein
MADAMVALSSTSALLAAMARAKEISIEAYTLHGPVLNAAEAAARRGAHVVVRLATPLGGRDRRLAGENAKLVAQLRAHGVESTLQRGLHAKEACVDGTRYFDEKNWWANDLVLRDADSADDSISATKFAALDAEGRLLRSASVRDRVIVESESFGCCNAVYDALAKLGAAGAAPRLLVSERDLHGNARERHALERLVNEGVRVRVCKDSKKLAAAGDRVWAGSANATVAFGACNAIDWGCCTDDGTIARAVRQRLEHQWTRARDFEPDASRATAR